MVFLAIAIITKLEKLVLSRQFVPFEKSKIEGMLASFPKLLTTSNSQHTFVETDAVRYIYKPLDNLYIVGITNKGSNIVIDLQVLNKVSNVILEISGSLTPEALRAKAFDLIDAFDEIVTPGGLHEPVDVHQVKTNLEMESHEEKLQQMILENKIGDAEAEGRKKAEQIRGRISTVGITSDSVGINAARASTSMPRPEQEPVHTTKKTESRAPPAIDLAPSESRPKGMRLGKPSESRVSSTPRGLAAVMKEEGVESLPTSSYVSSPTSSVSIPTSVEEVMSDPVNILLEEKMTIRMDRGGNVESMDLKGNFTVICTTDESTHCVITVDKAGCDAFQFQCHPSIDRAKFASDSVVVMKSQTKSYTLEKPVKIVAWKSAGNTVPLTINCWAEVTGTETNVSMEYSLDLPDMELNDVKIVIPTNDESSPLIKSADGDHEFDSGEMALSWKFPSISSANPSGSMEFEANCTDENSLFPIEVSFRSSQVLCPIKVSRVTTADGRSDLKYRVIRKLEVDRYVIN